MSIVLLGSTSGSCTLQEQAVAGTTVLTLPTTSGTVVVGSSAVSAAGQIPFSTDGTTYTPTAKIVSGTAVNAATGSPTTIDFISIPSWVKRITVMFSGVSVSGTSNLLVQLGDSGGIETTGYTSNAGGYGSAAVASSIGLLLNQQNTAAGTWSGMQVITSLLSSNTWSSVSTLSNGGTGTTALQMSGGTKSLSDTLTQIRITTVNGTDTFDAGTINILYE
jgi:hypothetical protein